MSIKATQNMVCNTWRRKGSLGLHSQQLARHCCCHWSPVSGREHHVPRKVLYAAGEELTAALARACASPPLLPELACASALATALLLVPRQFWMAWLLAAAWAKASALPLACAKAAASAGNTPTIMQGHRRAQTGVTDRQHHPAQIARYSCSQPPIDSVTALVVRSNSGITGHLLAASLHGGASHKSPVTSLLGWREKGPVHTGRGLPVFETLRKDEGPWQQPLSRGATYTTTRNAHTCAQPASGRGRVRTCKGLLIGSTAVLGDGGCHSLGIRRGGAPSRGKGVRQGGRRGLRVACSMDSRQSFCG